MLTTTLSLPGPFGGWLKNLRLRKAMRQRELARILAVSRETIRRYEADQSRPAKDAAAAQQRLQARWRI